MGVSYAPGSTPEAPDWDGGERECGNGLHFSPRPLAALSFHRTATRYAACPVPLDEIAVHPDGEFPAKVKARRVVAPGCFAVDLDGEPIQAVPARDAAEVSADA